MKIERITCPCWLRCAWHSGREKAVNKVLAEGMISSSRLNVELIHERYTCSEAKKAIHFLYHRGSRGEKEGCTFVTVLKKDNGGLLHAEGNDKIFVSRFLNNEELYSHARTFTQSQKKMLEVFEKQIFKTYYLSSYEARKLIPCKGDQIVADLNRLRDFGFIKKLEVSLPRTIINEVHSLEEILSFVKNPPKDPFTFYVDQKSETAFHREELTPAIDELTEFLIIYDVLGTLMKVYPSGLVEWSEDIIRPKSKDSLVSTKGLSFDAFLRLEHQIGHNQFIAIDVYTRFPVGNTVAQNFCQKIRRVGNAFGLLLAKRSTATARASFVCKKNGVGFLTIEDLGISYDDIRERVKKGERKRNFRQYRMEQFKQVTTECNRKEGYRVFDGRHIISSVEGSTLKKS